MKLIKERSPNTIHVFDTFFHTSLNRFGHWKNKNNLDIFAYEKLFIPIHEFEQWSLVYVDLVGENGLRSIRFYSSNADIYLDHPEPTILCSILKPILVLLKNEYLVKNHETLTWEWNLEIVKNCPQQLYQYDCGVFLCMFAEYLSRNVPLNFSQSDIMHFRKQLHLEIMNGKLCESVK